VAQRRRDYYFSWLVRLLPYIEQDNMHRSVNWNRDAFRQQPLNGTPLKLLQCASDSRAELVVEFTSPPGRFALTSYLAVNGINQLRYDGIIHVNSRVRIGHISDGTSNTLAVGERVPSNTPQRDGRFIPEWGWWFAGAGGPPDFGATDVVLGTNEVTVSRSAYSGQAQILATHSYRPGKLNDPIDEHRWHFWGLHPSGANFQFADGSVRNIPYGIGQDLLNRLATYKGGEVASTADF
jgi:prepilin-type processing-associated H-X9-DG protein